MISKLVEELRKREGEGEARALPAACYSDPEFFKLELDHVLRPGWHAVARWDELPNPGDYRALDLVGERILLVRGSDGNLRAMSGLCLHRAFPLVEGQGQSKEGFTCPYHRWAYDLRGCLKGAPFMDDVAGFNVKEGRLAQFPLEIWQGFVCVSTNTNAEPLAPQLTALAELLAPCALDQAIHADAADWDSPWNWKVMVENFMESYHHMGPHARSLGQKFPAKGTHDLPIEGPCAVLENPSADGESPFWVIQVFPTLMFVQSRGAAPFAAWYEMQIDRYDHIHLRIHSLLPEALAQNEGIVRILGETLRDVHLEDIAVCEGIQKGIQSTTWQPGLLSHQEATMARFHRHLIEKVSASLRST